MLPVKHQNCVVVVLYRKTDSLVEYALFERILNWKGTELCKGGIEMGESAEEAALREVQEETGISLTEIIPTTSKTRYGFTSYSKKGEKVRIERDFTVFLGDVTGHTPKPNGIEHDRIWFAPFEQALEALTYSNMKNLLKELDPMVRA